MSDKTKIEWTDATWNPLRARNKATGKIGWHCVKISPACDNCYAATQNEGAHFGGTGLPYSQEAAEQVEVFLDMKSLMQPLHWRRPRRIFVCSMTDIFGSFVNDGWIDLILSIAAQCPQHTFQFLTKRAKRMAGYFRRLEEAATAWEVKLQEKTPGNTFTARDVLNLRWVHATRLGGPNSGYMCGNPLKTEKWPLPNVHLGVTVENQEMANERIPFLFDSPAACRFLSCEPLLGDLSLDEFLKVVACPRCGGIIYRSVANPKAWCSDCCVKEVNLSAQENRVPAHDGRFPATPAIRQVIVGGESGGKARQLPAPRVQLLRDECIGFGTAFFFKQWGEWLPPMQDGAPQKVGQSVDGQWINASDEFIRVGKKKAGRLLDSREWSEYPKMEAAT